MNLKSRKELQDAPEQGRINVSYTEENFGDNDHLIPRVVKLLEGLAHLNLALTLTVDLCSIEGVDSVFPGSLQQSQYASSRISVYRSVSDLNTILYRIPLNRATVRKPSYGLGQHLLCCPISQEVRHSPPNDRADTFSPEAPRCRNNMSLGSNIDLTPIFSYYLSRGSHTGT